MKRNIFYMAICVFAMAGFALLAHAEPIKNPAGSYVTQVFTQYTGLASTARYSGVFKVDRNTIKTVVFAAYSTNGTDILATMPGTAIAQCAATITGPYVTAKDRGTNAVSATTSTIFDLDSRCQYMRFGWTKTGSGKRSLSAWLLYGDQ